MTPAPRAAPPLSVTRWLNAPEDLTLEALRGRVVAIEAFQMLCPGCVAHGLPQAQRVFEAFPREDVAVVGLHTVFEHHEAQGTEAALAAFLHEYRFGFPVGIDAPSASGPIPRTMAAYAMQGTPTLILLDRRGRLRAQHFGHVPDLWLGATIARLMAEDAGDPAFAPADRDGAPRAPDACDEAGCAVDP
jgi:hypothetical protein